MRRLALRSMPRMIPTLLRTLLPSLVTLHPLRMPPTDFRRSSVGLSAAWQASVHDGDGHQQQPGGGCVNERPGLTLQTKRGNRVQHKGGGGEGLTRTGLKVKTSGN
jgi:hypothetical protein